MVLLIFFIQSVFAVDLCADQLATINTIARIKARLLLRRTPIVGVKLAMNEFDIAQEIIMESYRFLDDFDPNLGTFEMYISKKMNWAIYTLMRRSYKFKINESINEEDKNEELEPIDIREVKEFNSDTIEYIHKLIEKIPSRSVKRHLKLFIEGKTYEEIASIENIEVTRVRKSVNKGIRHLKAIVEFREKNGAGS